jgi:hypothetical protein
MDVSFGSDICFAAMLNLVTFGSDAGLNKKKLLNKGAVKQIKRAQMNGLMSLRAREHTLQLLELLEISTSHQNNGVSFIGVVYGSKLFIIYLTTINKYICP